MVSLTQLTYFLTYFLSCVILDVGSYSIHRTAENKPYVKFDKSIITSWNYNVSHHGKYVAIASHAHCSIGTHFFSIHCTLPLLLTHSHRHRYCGYNNKIKYLSQLQ